MREHLTPLAAMFFWLVCASLAGSKTIQVRSVCLLLAGWQIANLLLTFRG